jgi:hypothetical protein
LPSTSWPITSMVGKKMSKFSCPVRSLAIASSMLLNVVSSTLQLYFLPKSFMIFGLR